MLPSFEAEVDVGYDLIAGLAVSVTLGDLLELEHLTHKNPLADSMASKLRFPS